MKKVCHISIPHYIFYMIVYNFSTHSIIYQRFLYIIYTMPKNGGNYQIDTSFWRHCDVKIGFYKRNCHISIPHYIFYMIEYNFSTHSIIYQSLLYIIYTLWLKTVQKCPKSQLCDVKMTSKSLFSEKKYLPKFLKSIFLWGRLCHFFSLFCTKTDNFYNFPIFLI